MNPYYLCIIADCCPCPEHNTTRILNAHNTVVWWTFSCIKLSSQSMPKTRDISSHTIVFTKFRAVNNSPCITLKHLFRRIICSPSHSFSKSLSLRFSPFSVCVGKGSVYAMNWPRHSKSLGRGCPPNNAASNWMSTFFVLTTLTSLIMYKSLETSWSSLIVRRLCVLCAVSVASSSKCSSNDFIRPPGAPSQTSNSHIKSCNKTAYTVI